MSTWEIVVQVAPPLVSGAAGVALSTWRFWSTLQKRLTALEIDRDAKGKRIEELEKTQQRHHEEFDRKFDTNRAEHNRFVGITAFTSFTGEQNELWQTMNRTLGRIEGELLAKRERGSWTNET